MYISGRENSMSTSEGEGTKQYVVEEESCHTDMYSETGLCSQMKLGRVPRD